MTDPGGDAAEPRSHWGEAAERLRSNGRLFVVSLGSVGATIAVGLSLTGLGGLEPGSDRFVVAIVGAGMAVLGIIVLLALSVSLASASSVSLSAVQTKGFSFKSARRVVNKPDNGFLAGHDDLDSLAAAARTALVSERLALEAYVAGPNEALHNDLKVRRAHATWYRQRLRILAEVASFQRLRWRFFAAALAMAVAAAIAATGIIMYAWAISAEDPPSALVVVEPNELVSVAAPEDLGERAQFHALLDCEVDAIDALVIGGEEGSAEVATLPDDEEGCRSVPLTVRELNGLLVPAFGTEDEGTEAEGDAGS